MSLVALHDIARSHGGLVTRAAAIASGTSSQRLTDLVRRGALARVARGVYAVGPRMLPDPHRVALDHRVVISYWSAASWWGVDVPSPARHLHATAPRNRGCRKDALPGVRLHRATLRPDEVVIVRGVPVTTPVRTAIDVSRIARLDDAVAVADSFCRAGLMTVDEFVAAADDTRGPGRHRVRLVASLIDPASGSILESLTRVLLWRHNLCPPRSQYSLRHRRTGWVGYLDFAWPELRVALECDGYEFHAGRPAFEKDRRRWSALTRAGWRLGVVTWFDVTADPAYVVSLVRDLMAGVEHTSGTPETPAAVA